MHDYSRDFEISPGQIWLNAASEGPLPKVAAEALQEALSWKMSPDRLTIAKFQQVPLGLKRTIARLINVHADDIILGNSATYGLHLLANGLPLAQGDEIVVMQNDFPSDILPWLHLQRRGIAVRQLAPHGLVVTEAEVRGALSKRTKVVCLPHIHSFSGLSLDITAIGQLCRQCGILFVVNMSQSVGAMEVDVGRLPVDAVVCAGYKWLLGPYGTGFCWMRREVLEALEYPQAYWISLMDERSLAAVGPLQLPELKSSRRYDVFGTANFFNFHPWRASIDYLLGVGISRIAAHNAALVRHIREGFAQGRFEFAAAEGGIVVFSHRNRARNPALHRHLMEKGLHLALWKGSLRASPHLYNRPEEMERLVRVVNDYES